MLIFIVVTDTEFGTVIGNVFTSESDALIEATEKGGRVVCRVVAESKGQNDGGTEMKG